MQSQVRIDNFKKEKKTARSAASRVGRVFGYIFSALVTLMLVCLVTGIIVACVFSIYVSNYIDPTIDESLLVTGKSEQTTKIYYYEFTDRTNRAGTAIELEDQRIYGAENSLWASYDEIPTYLREAFIAIEDKRFMTHKGVDWKRTAGAVLNFFLGFDDSSYGGSTITQQLIKNLTGNNKKVAQYVLKHDITKEFINRLAEILRRLIPYYIKEGKYSLTVALGCTGGHHRSVAVANEVYRIFAEEGRRVTLEHRDL
mgnify:FL=1